MLADNCVRLRTVLCGEPHMLMLFALLALFPCVLISVAYFTLLERKLLAAIHRRKGPDKVGL